MSSYSEAEMVAMDRVENQRFMAAEFRRNHPEFFPDNVRSEEFSALLDQVDRSTSANRFNP